MSFDPSTATLASDPDASTVADWIRSNSPGLKSSERQAAAEGMVAALKGGHDGDAGAQQMLQHSFKAMPLAVRKGIRREFFRAQAAAKHSGAPMPKTPGEFFAVEGPKLLHARFTGRGSWRAQAKSWLTGALAHTARTAGARSDEPALQSLTAILAGGKPP